MFSLIKYRTLLSPLCATHCYSTRAIATTRPLPAHNDIEPPPAKLSKWKRVTDVPLTRENYIDLLYGRTPLIKEPDFLTTAQCREYEKLLSSKLTPYKHNTGPLLTKYGVAQFEYQAQAAKDFLSRSNGKICLRITAECAVATDKF